MSKKTKQELELEIETLKTQLQQKIIWSRKLERRNIQLEKILYNIQISQKQIMAYDNNLQPVDDDIDNDIFGFDED